MNKCRLCRKDAELQDSHLLPNFALKRFYRTSPTGGARSVGEPNRRAQGTFLQKPLLCYDCEQRFGLRERIWADVDRRLSGQLPWSFECTEAHRYFAASIAWRILVWWDDMDGKPLTLADVAAIEKAEAKLRGYLLEEAPYPETFPWLHLVIAPNGFTGAPAGLNTYLRASLDATLNGWDEGLYCIAVFGGYLVVAVLSVSQNSLITWTLGTELQPGRMVLADARAFPEDPEFRKILTTRAAASRQRPLSNKQQQQVNQRVEAVLDTSLRLNPQVIAIMTDHLNEPDLGNGKKSLA
jgi:hypothetical protein